MARLLHLPLAVFERSYSFAHHGSDRYQFFYCDLARDSDQRAYEMIREQYARASNIIKD